MKAAKLVVTAKFVESIEPMGETVVPISSENLRIQVTCTEFLSRLFEFFCAGQKSLIFEATQVPAIHEIKDFLFSRGGAPEMKKFGRDWRLSGVIVC
jgi:hypothetical protein